MRTLVTLTLLAAVLLGGVVIASTLVESLSNSIETIATK